MNEGFNALVINGSWELGLVTRDIKVIHNKLVFRTKTKLVGLIEKVQGYDYC